MEDSVVILGTSSADFYHASVCDFYVLVGFCFC